VPGVRTPIILSNPDSTPSASKLPRIAFPPENQTKISNDLYIDPDRYDLGATSSYEAPAAVVLSERSTGCQTILRRGQTVPGSLCSPALKPTAAPRQVGGRAGALAVAINTLQPRSTTASARRYYNQTRRPPGRLGNGNIRLLFPLSLPAPITSIFGWRVHPISGARRFHAGTDLGAPMGTPVLAAYAGRVAIADFLGGYGLLVTLRHRDNTEETRYAHLSEIFVKPGEWVEQGSVIGRVGSTGYSTGPHLHFEFRERSSQGWIAQDPGFHLESAMAKLVEMLKTAQTKPQSGA